VFGGPNEEQLERERGEIEEIGQQLHRTLIRRRALSEIQTLVEACRGALSFVDRNRFQQPRTQVTQATTEEPTTSTDSQYLISSTLASQLITSATDSNDFNQHLAVLSGAQQSQLSLTVGFSLTWPGRLNIGRRVTPGRRSGSNFPHREKTRQDFK
jgi:hypothetical protein